MISLNNCNIIAMYFSLDIEPEFLLTPNREIQAKKYKIMTYNGWHVFTLGKLSSLSCRCGTHFLGLESLDELKDYINLKREAYLFFNYSMLQSE